MYLSLKPDSLKSIKHLNYKFEISDERYSLFGPLSSVNFLVGANNSGKSSFLRKLLIEKDSIFSSTATTFDKINQIREFITSNYGSFQSNAMVNVINIATPISSALLEETPALKKYITLISNEDIILNKDTFERYVKKIDAISKNAVEDFNNTSRELISKLSVGIESIKLQHAYRQLKNNGALKPQLIDQHLIEKFLIEIHRLLKEYINDPLLDINPPERKYIPILRTLSTLWDSSKTQPTQNRVLKNIFEGTILQSYFNSEVNEDVKICTGLDLYNDILLIRNSQKNIRKSIESFELFLSQIFFNGKDVEIIAKQSTIEKERHIYIYLDGIEDDIHKFGDGIQTIILLFYPIFTAEKGSWIFIEEPELNLHPGFQRIFLNTILNHPALLEKELYYFFTTHSNHLLDLLLTHESNVSIFTFHEKFEKNERIKFISNVKNSSPDSLELLGVNNSSVYLANCSIWVEGHTDTLFIRAFLNAYLSKLNKVDSFKEDIHYSFFEYGGSNVSHYLFGDSEDVEEKDRALIKARFLNNKILLIADKDQGKENKHKYLMGLKSKNFDYLFLSVQEMENHLTEDQLKTILPIISKKLSKINWDKINLEYDKYKNIYLGKYLKDRLKVNFPSSMKEPSGTLKTYYKTKIANELNKSIRWDTMGKDSKIFIEYLYNYINSCNSK